MTSNNVRMVMESYASFLGVFALFDGSSEVGSILVEDVEGDV